MAEQRYNNQSGFLGTALDPSTPGTSQAITGLFSVAPDFAALSDGDSIKLALDAGIDTFEIVYLTVYDPASPLDGTITRAAEDSTNWPAVGHQAGTGTWTCAPTVEDFTSGGGAVSSVFGRTGDVVAASGDYTAAEVGAASVDAGVPSGGTTNQVLAKNSNTDYDTGWVDQSGGGSGTVSSVNDIDPDGSGNVTLAASDVGAAPATSGTAILKGDGSGGTASATAGTDYLAPSGSGASLTGITPSQVGAAATADNLSDLSSASDAAHNLGLGTADTPTFSGLILSTAGGTGRLMGWTASGAPSTGTWTTGDTVLDNTGMVWTCTAGGTPGTWASLTSSAQAESDRRSDTLNQLAEPTAAVLFGGQQAKSMAAGSAATDAATLSNRLSDFATNPPDAAIPLGGQQLTGGAAATTPTGIPILSQLGGWVPDSNTWTYATATTFTVPGNVTAEFVGGTKLKWTDSGGTKYGVVQSSSYASSSTTVTMITTSSYTMASGTISSPQYSYGDPPDFPASFAWTPTWTGFSANPAAAICVWSVVGAIITFRFVTFGYGTSNNAAMTMSLPAPIGSGVLTYVAMGKDNGTFTTLAGAAASVGGTTLSLGRIDNAAMAGAGSTGFTSITASYPLR